MGSETEYAKFEEKVKRTIYLDNLSPIVTDAVIRTAFEQYGDVKSLHFIPNYTELSLNYKCALVELENEKQADAILDMVSAYPFMMAGMPRPVMARPAEAEMFEDRPAKPGRKIQLHWLDPTDPEFEVAQKLKDLTRKHHAEQCVLYKKQLEEEEELSKQQDEKLKGNFQKFEKMDAVTLDGSSRRLATRYKIKITDDYGG